MLLGERSARAFNELSVAGMYLVTLGAVLAGALTPFGLVIALALPRAVRAVRVMGRRAPAEPPPGYVGWPLWYHRVCLVHNRAFGWLYILGLAAGAVFPHVLVG